MIFSVGVAVTFLGFVGWLWGNFVDGFLEIVFGKLGGGGRAITVVYALFVAGLAVRII